MPYRSIDTWRFIMFRENRLFSRRSSACYLVNDWSFRWTIRFRFDIGFTRSCWGKNEVLPQASSPICSKPRLNLGWWLMYLWEFSSRADWIVQSWQPSQPENIPESQPSQWDLLLLIMMRAITPSWWPTVSEAIIIIFASKKSHSASYCLKWRRPWMSRLETRRNCRSSGFAGKHGGTSKSLCPEKAPTKSLAVIAITRRRKRVRVGLRDLSVAAA